MIFDIARVNVKAWKARRRSTKIQWEGKSTTMVGAKWRGWRYAGRRTRNYTKTMCLLSISGRTRWGFYESLERAPAWQSVVVYSRKESGPVAQMTLTPSPDSPFHRTIRQPAPRFTAIRFLPPLRAFVLSYCRRFCFLLRVNLLYLPPQVLLLLPLSSQLVPLLDGIFLLFDTNEYICTSKYEQIQV